MLAQAACTSIRVNLRASVVPSLLGGLGVMAVQFVFVWPDQTRARQVQTFPAQVQTATGKVRIFPARFPPHVDADCHFWPEKRGVGGAECGLF
jgi:hypothetical protein